ncbi:hypothetical protein BE20_24825 [Sorangium cellulosum]|uniref:Tyr recombinase domain-containing protein n=1 Tax=Sorangium cellulosum TaxID=56 RepID=A0A150S9X9_SORCE|nr:hypothetical protein BE20_24825 [Sorangium cellulosum]KYF89294.1 hypothetical protein BE18_22945 [Sorangium cellulosum]
MIRKVQRRGELRLFIDISYKKPDGTRARFRKDAEVQTMTAARAEERRILGNIAQYGSPYEPTAGAQAEAAPVITFGEAVALFREGKAITELKPSSRVTYEDVLVAKLLPRFGKHRLDQITFEEVQKLDAELVQAGLGASSRRNVIIVLRSVLGAAHELGKLPAIPKLPALPKVGKTVLRVLRQEEVDRTLSVSKPSARLAFSLAAYAGLRAGEVRGLRWTDVDFKAGEIVVRRARCKGEEAAPKSGHQRRIPIAVPLRPLLEAASKQKASPWTEVALTEQGKPWGEYGLLQAFKRAAKRAGLEDGWRFHDLRHFFVTRLLSSGAPTLAVKELAGHEELATTQRYAHAVQEDLRAAIARLGNAGATG